MSKCTDAVLSNDGVLMAAYPLALATCTLGITVVKCEGLVDKTQADGCARFRRIGERTTLLNGSVDPTQFDVKKHAVLRITDVHSACHVTSFRQLCIDMLCYALDTPGDIVLFQLEYNGSVFGDLRTIRHWKLLYGEFRDHALTWKSEPEAVWIVRTAIPMDLVSNFVNAPINEPTH
jgi:hypothetical protein